MKVLKMTNLFGDRQVYDLFLLLPSVNQLPCINQYIIYGRVHSCVHDLEPVRIIDNQEEALSFCQACNEARKEESPEQRLEQSPTSPSAAAERQGYSEA